MAKQGLNITYLYAWTPVLLWCGVIFTLSSIPTLANVGFIWWDFVLKKTAHIIEYTVLSSLLIRALLLSSSRPSLSFRELVAVSIITFLYAISDEYHQSFTPGRTPTAMDVGFDTIGLLLGLFIYAKSSKFSSFYNFFIDPFRLKNLAKLSKSKSNKS